MDTKLPFAHPGFIATKAGHLMRVDGVWAGWLYMLHDGEWVRVRKLGPVEIEAVEEYNKENTK